MRIQVIKLGFPPRRIVMKKANDISFKKYIPDDKEQKINVKVQ